MSDSPTIIRSPEAPALDNLCRRLAALGEVASRAWPAASLALCADYGVFEWFVDPEWGGQGWSDQAVLQAYLKLSAACLTTTFVITQRTGACRRIANAANDWAQSQLLPPLVRGESFATVGISHLTTSRRHLRQPVLGARPCADGYILDGYAPWVTGAAHAEHVVVGATLADGDQILVAAPRSGPGITVGEPYELVGLRGSDTAELRFDGAVIDRACLLAGPSANVMRQGLGARTGGLQTSTLALGLTAAILGYLEREGRHRPPVAVAAAALGASHRELVGELLAAAAGAATRSPEVLRTEASALVLRAARAAVVAAKGAGYVAGHPVGRWLREAHFFLVWSLPEAVAEASLGGLDGALAAP